MPRAQLVAVAVLLVGGLFLTFIVALRVAEKQRPWVVHVDSNESERCAERLFGLWTAYGDHPFVDGSGWNARDYTLERCQSLTNHPE